MGLLAQEKPVTPFKGWNLTHFKEGASGSQRNKVECHKDKMQPCV